MIDSYKPNLDRLPEGIRKLSSEEKIYLYGNGGYAQRMLGILDKFHIVIEGILVSRKYYEEKMGGGI